MVSRRGFLTGAAAAAGGIVFLPRSPFAAARARSRHLARVADPTGTTLEASIVPVGPGPYRALAEGPGWPMVVRSDLAAPGPGREDRRRALAAVVQLTDMHVTDAQSPGRVEYLDDADPLFSAAWRPQELMSVHVGAAMAERLRAIGRGPVTGRTFDCAVSTGDNIDNQQSNELDWFIRILDGGTLVGDSGDPGSYEGVQDVIAVAERYWHPDPGVADRWKGTYGYPDVPGLIDAAIAPFTSPGLPMPWYSTFGNHDGLLQGNLANGAAMEGIVVGDRKITELPAGIGALEFVVTLATDPAKIATALAAGQIPHRTVTPDPERRPITPTSWVQAHLDSPLGTHGYTPDHLAGGDLHYAFSVAPGVLGVSLDTCNHFGGVDGADGSIGEGQLRWLEARIQEVSSQWIDADGYLVRGAGGDQAVVVFSHHTSTTMDARDPHPDRPGERRVQGPELVATLLRYPNVVAWVNGHTHAHGIVPHADPSYRTGGFWEITTASHIDWPEHSRIIELTDNADGTLSLHCTVVEHAGPAATDPDDLSVLGLAAWSRELGANDPQIDRVGKLGPPEVRNVELLLHAPFVRGVGERPAAAPAEPVPAPAAFTG